MKKSLFGFSAKVAMAVLAVCSFVLTSCYEKTPVAKTPSEYYVVGSVYDAVTGDVISGATVTVAGKTVSSTFNIKLDAYQPSVQIIATAPGYARGERVVEIQELAQYNQLSITNADLALVKLDEPEIELEIGEVVPANLDKDAVASTFGITLGDVMVDPAGTGKVKVFLHYSLDKDLHANLHTNFNGGSHVNHDNGVTYDYLVVKDSTYTGYVAAMPSALDEDMALVFEFAMNLEMNAVRAGDDYSAFKNSFIPFTTVLNPDGELALAGYCLTRNFVAMSFPFILDGQEHNILALKAVSTVIDPLVADTHDNHVHHHGGATAWGGGAADAE